MPIIALLLLMFSKMPTLSTRSVAVQSINATVINHGKSHQDSQTAKRTKTLFLGRIDRLQALHHPHQLLLVLHRKWFHDPIFAKGTTFGTESQNVDLTVLFSVSHSGCGPLGGSKAVFLPVGNGYFGINLDDFGSGGALTELAKKETNHEINYTEM